MNRYVGGRSSRSRDLHFKPRPIGKMMLKQLFVLCFFLFVIFDGTNSQFFGRQARQRQQTKRVNPNNNSSYYDNQCHTGKCRRLDNFFCGVGSKYIWYFVTKIVLTYCEKIMFYIVIEKNFWNSNPSPRISNIFEINRTI